MLTKIQRGPIWYLRGTVAGQRVYESTGTRDRGAAEIIRRRREAEIIERHALGRAATLTFAEAALTYMQGGGETRFLAPLIAHFGPDTPLADIDNAAVNIAADALLPGRAAATINRQIITPISAVLNMAADEGLAAYRRLRRRPGDNARTRWLSPEEAERLLRHAAPHLRVVLGFLLGGGCRVAEALSIDRAHFYPNTGEAHLPLTKNGHPRMIRLPGRAVDLVLSRPLPDVGIVCRTPKGQAYVQRENGGGQIAAAFAQARRSAGLGPDVTPHVLRHSWATWFHAATGDFGQLLDLGGWRKADMAQRYRKLAPADLPERLQAHGWDFTDLGRVRGKACNIEGLRLVK